VPWHELAQGFAATAAAVSLTMLSAAPALADNELAEKYGGGLDTSLIDTSCFKPDGACGAAAQSCLRTDNCRRGMTCTAKCLGDNACITGCFAKYGNEPMNDLLECSIERHECIKVAILPAGPDKASEAPMPPLTPVANFNTRSLEGSWYKVMGYNNRYDCFDCQVNSFKVAGKDKLDVDVEFQMPRPGKDGKALAYPLRLSEKLVIDSKQAPDSVLSQKHRHASTEGHMFGLTFWENWSVIGENTKDEPEFKFVHYSGRTSQNTYEGAFVYAREPSLPAGAKKHVYEIAKSAGWTPSEFCAVRNGADVCNAPATDDVALTQMQSVSSSALDALRGSIGVGAASAAEVDEASYLSERQPAWLSRLGTLVDEFASYAEDPRITEKWVFSQQRKMGD
jgi:lipocalin